MDGRNDKWKDEKSKGGWDGWKKVERTNGWKSWKDKWMKGRIIEGMNDGRNE